MLECKVTEFCTSRGWAGKSGPMDVGLVEVAHHYCRIGGDEGAKVNQ